jgi:putative resolvase
MKLSAWAKSVGISYRTAWRWYKEGKLPVEAEQTPTGTIIIKEPREEGNQAAIYARVSSHDQKEGLEKQVGRLIMFANERKLFVTQTVVEIGSALNP